MSAVLAGAAGFMPVYVMGLAVPMFIVGPLALLTGALLASLSAGWVANIASGGSSAGTRSRLWAIFAVSLAASPVGVLVASGGAFLVNEFDVGMRYGVDLMIVYLPGAFVFAGATAFAAWRLRTPAAEGLGLWGRAALALAAAWMILLMLMASMLTGGPGFYTFGRLFGPGAGFVILLGGRLVLTALGIFLVVHCLRTAGGRSLRRDASLSFLALGLTPALLAGTIFLGCSISYCMP